MKQRARQLSFLPKVATNNFLMKMVLKERGLVLLDTPLWKKYTILLAFELHIDTFRQRGAQVIDNLKIDHIDTILDPNQSGEISIMMADFKTHINIYLKELHNSLVRSLTDVIAFNENNAELEKLTEYDQHTFIEADKTDGLGEHEKVTLDTLDIYYIKILCHVIILEISFVLLTISFG